MSHTVSLKSTAIKSLTALQRAVERLKASGVNVSLEPNAVPRMYYKNQLAIHVKAKQDQAIAKGEKHEGLRFHENPDECDYVLKVNDAFYDIGFIYNNRGELVPFFDDYNHASPSVPGTLSGKGPIRSFLGAKFEGAVQHWSGEREADESMMHSIGQLLQNYSLCALLEEAEAQGVYGADVTVDNDGNMHLTVQVN